MIPIDADGGLWCRTGSDGDGRCMGLGQGNLENLGLMPNSLSLAKKRENF